MKQLNCIIIEDQIPAQQTLQEYIRQVPYLHLLATYISPIEAMEQLDSGAIDLMFLDIHLPKINGIDFLAALRQPPHIILTTAFSEYAVQGFELDVVDYLLKPYSFQRFLKAILKIQRIESSKETASTSEHLFIKTKQQQIEKIFLPEVKYIEAKGDFVVINMLERSVIATISLQQLLQEIGSQFCRCHKSFVINIQAISKISGNRIFIHNKEIPIGRTFKEELLRRIKMI